MEKADPPCCTLAIGFQHLFTLHRGKNVLRGHFSELSVSLSPQIRHCHDSFSKEHKQTSEVNF